MADQTPIGQVQWDSLTSNSTRGPRTISNVTLMNNFGRNSQRQIPRGAPINQLERGVGCY